MKRSPPALGGAAAALWLAALLAAETIAQTADPTPPIPEFRRTHGRVERQRIRYKNSPLLKKAHRQIAAKNHRGAAANLERVLGNDPDNNHARVALVHTYVALGEWRKGIEQCQALIADYPEYADPYFILADLAGRADKSSLALETLAALVDRLPAAHKRRAEAYAKLARLSLDLDRIDEAVAHARQWSALSDTAAAHRFLAECAIRREQWPAALEALDRALALSQGAEARGLINLQLGYVYTRLQRYDEATTALREAEATLGAGEYAVAARRQLGQVAMLDKRYEDAARHLGASLQAGGFDEATASSYIDALLQTKQFETGLAQAVGFVDRVGVSREFRLRMLNRLKAIYYELGDDYQYFSIARELAREDPHGGYELETAMAAVRIGDRVQARRLYREALAKSFDAEHGLNYYYLLKQDREYGLGEGVLQQVLAAADAGPEILRAARYELAQIYRLTDRAEAYGEAMKAVLAAAGAPDFFFEYASHLLATGRAAEAVDPLVRSLDGGDKERNFGVCKRLADMRLAAGDYAGAVDWLEKARTFGEPDDDWHVARIKADLGEGKFDEAMDRVEAVGTRGDHFNMLMGFAFGTLKMSGLALHHLKLIDDPDAIPEGQKFAYFANLAYLHFDQGDYSNSVVAAEQARIVQDSRELDLVRVKALRMLGRYADARQAGLDLLVSLEADPRGTHLLADLYETLGYCHYDVEEYDRAVELFTSALAADVARTNVYYVRGLGHYRRADGDRRRAESVDPERQWTRGEERSFQRAKRADARLATNDFHRIIDNDLPMPVVFWGDVGFVEGYLENYEEGRAALGKVVAFYRYDLDSLRELGYQEMRDIRNERAKQTLRRAVDIYRTINPYLEGEDREAYEVERRAMMMEYSKLAKVWGGGAYVNVNEFDDELEEAFRRRGATTTEGVLRNEAGAMLTYRPPKLGFRNERTLDVFVRGLASFAPNSASLDSDSYQGGVGLLWKPLESWNYSTSFERLFKIGDDSEDNWLWRSIVGHEWGERRQRGRDLWLTSRIYAEAAYYLDDLERDVYYVDGRIGPSLALADRTFITVPQVKAVWRKESHDSDIGTYWMIGVGADLRVWEGEGRYTTKRWYVDGFLHYMRGRFDDEPDALKDPEFEGWTLGLNFVK